MTATALKTLVGYVRRVSARDFGTLPDKELLDRVSHDRDEAAYAEIVRRHGPMVLGVCRRVLRHEHDAEDAFQAAFLVLVRKAGSIRGGTSLGGWLFQVAHRLALRARIGDQRRRQRTGPLLEDIPETPPPSFSNLPRVLDEELQGLPELHRSAIVLCYLEGHSQAEAARLLQTTPEAINSRLKRARETLRQRLARQGIHVSVGALITALTSASAGAVCPVLVRETARAALEYLVNPATCGAAAAVALARGSAMSSFPNKLLCALALALGLAAMASFLLPVEAVGDDVPKAAARQNPPAVEEQKPQADGKLDKARHCIILWMSGGPSQLDTFDLKPGQPNGGPFRPIDTVVKGVQISEHLPRLARLTNHMTMIRSLTHREGDHARGAFLMRTGYTHDGQTLYPPLGALLAKELPPGTDVPRYVTIAPDRRIAPTAHGSGFLGPKYGPLVVAERGGFPRPAADTLPLPPLEVFQAIDKDAGEKARKTIESAFDLNDEKATVRDAYGRTVFGQGCLLARRLVERGVPVVEVSMGGWDTHADNFTAVAKLSAQLDAGWASLLTELNDRKLLDKTLIVWMGEFGRTPRINNQEGRDHYPLAFSVVLAGAGIKGGQVIGRTSADGITIEANPVTPAELNATIFRALGVDPALANPSNTGRPARLVETGTKAVKEALR